MSSDANQGPTEDAPHAFQELHDLCAALCDGTLTVDRERRLAEILRSGPRARALYLRYIALHSTFLATGGEVGEAPEYRAQLAVERLAIERFAGRLSPDPRPRTPDAPPSISAPNPRWAAQRWLSRGALAASLLLAAGWIMLRVGSTAQDGAGAPPDPPGATIARSASPLPESPHPDSPDPVAEVTFVADQVVWRNPNASYARSSRVRTGDVLAFHQGKLELTYSNGARLLLAGPSEFVVRADGGQLRLGELVARVPESGHGFTIETPQGKVVDLGTEFGVVVDDFGISQVSVFEGKVETTPISEIGSGRPPIELTSGKAIQWDGSSFVPISFQGRRHRLAGDDRNASGSSALQGNTPQVIELGNFADRPSAWCRTGDVTPASPVGVALRGGGPTRLPHLMTSSQHDPDKGAVSVVCDLRFAHPSSASEATFTLLSRAAASPSTPGKAWEGQLARGVRCRLRADLGTGEVRLEAGVKQEADREPTTISWGGFTRQVPGARYRLEMRDDGLNVSFTVTLADNPAVTKTITCRSLFRGDENFVAIEGPAECDAIVERLTVRQEPRSADEEAVSIALRDRVLPAEQGGPDDAEIAKLLDALAPAGAQLVLRETFDNDTLDPKLWSTLGDVYIERGRAVIGKGNPTGHINTWRRRPYLLTAAPLDWARSSVAVVGFVNFAENFLHGYGGSFAVMTRASDTYSEAPAWENSVLSRGVRSNFWPAAFGFGHSFEIHERLPGSPIQLLVADSAATPTRSRRYAFCVIDDGKEVAATFLDASDRGPRADGRGMAKTVRATTSPGGDLTGRIGLESCWGSPVELNEVRIYTINHPANSDRPQTRSTIPATAPPTSE